MAKKSEAIDEGEVVEFENEDAVEVKPVIEDAPAIVIRPEAQYVFDAVEAEKWLTSASARLRGVFQSVRFDPEGMPEEQLGFLLLLVGRSIMKEYTLRDRSVHQGRFFVPADLPADKFPASFEGLEMVAQEDGWAVYGVK